MQLHTFRRMAGPEILRLSKSIEGGGVQFDRAHALACQLNEASALAGTSPDEVHQRVNDVLAEHKGNPKLSLEVMLEKSLRELRALPYAPVVEKPEPKEEEEDPAPTVASMLARSERRSASREVAPTPPPQQSAADREAIRSKLALCGGRNDIEKAMNYLRAQPGGAALAYDELTEAASKLVRQMRGIGGFE